MGAAETVVWAAAVMGAVLWVWGIYDVLRSPRHAWRASGQDKASALVMQICVPIIGVLVHLIVVRPVLNGSELRPRLRPRSRPGLAVTGPEANTAASANATTNFTGAPSRGPGTG